MYFTTIKKNRWKKRIQLFTGPSHSPETAQLSQEGQDRLVQVGTATAGRYIRLREATAVVPNPSLELQEPPPRKPDIKVEKEQINEW